jgi:hypothetical protein
MLGIFWQQPERVDHPLPDAPLTGSLRRSTQGPCVTFTV